MPCRLVAVLLWSIVAFVIASTPAALAAPRPLQIERCIDCGARTTPAAAARGRYVPEDLKAPRGVRDGVTWYRLRWTAPARWLIVDDGVDRGTLFTAAGAQTAGMTVASAHRTVHSTLFRVDRVRPGARVMLRVSGAMPMRFAALADAPDGLPLPIALFFGLMGAAALAACALAITTRERAIGAYAVWLAAMLLFESVRYDVAPIVFLPFAPLSQTVTFYGTLSLALAALLRFARVLLRTPATLPRIDLALQWTMGALPLFATVAWLGIRAGRLPVDALDRAWEASFFTVAAAIGTAIVLRLRAGSRVALLFACSFGVLFVFATVYVVAGVPWSSVSWVADYGGELGTVAEAAVLSFAIAARIAEGRRLERAVATIGDVLLQVGRDGRLVFVSANGHALFDARAVQKASFATLLDEADAPAARRLARLAVRGRRAVGEVRVRTRDGVLWCEAAVRAVSRDGRTDAFQISLRDISERKAFEAQLARAGALRVLEPRGMRVDVFAGQATVDDVDAELGAREFELLAFLALRADAVTRDAVVDAIWPDAEGEAGRNALRVTVTRVRGRLRARDAIVHQRGMYRLGTGIAVDVREAQKALASDDAALIEASAAHVLRSLPAALLGREWFAPYATLLESLRSRVVVRACDVFLAAGRANDAAALASLLVTIDPLDEDGYLAQARALTAAGDAAGARRVARACERVLRDELATAPSAALSAFSGTPQ